MTMLLRRVGQAAVAAGSAAVGFDASRQVREGPQAYVRWRYAGEGGAPEMAKRLADVDETLSEARGAVVQGLEQLRAQPTDPEQQEAARGRALVLYGPSGAGREVLTGDVADAGANYLRLDASAPPSPFQGLDANPGTLFYRLFFGAHYASRETDAVSDALRASHEDWVLHGVHPEEHVDVIEAAAQRPDEGSLTVFSVDAPVLDAVHLPEGALVAAIRVGDPSSEAAKVSRVEAFRSVVRASSGDVEKDEDSSDDKESETEGKKKDDGELEHLVKSKLGLRLADLAAAAAAATRQGVELEAAADDVIETHAAELRSIFVANTGIAGNEQVKAWLWDAMKLVSGCELVSLVGASHLATAHEAGVPLHSLPAFEFVGSAPPRLADLTSELGDLLEVREPTGASGMPTMVSVRTPVGAAFKQLYEDDDDLCASVSELQKRVHLAQDLHKLAQDLQGFFVRQGIFDEQVENLLQLVLTADDPDDPEILNVRINLEAEKLDMQKSRGLLLRRLAELREAKEGASGAGASCARVNGCAQGFSIERARAHEGSGITVGSIVEGADKDVAGGACCSLLVLCWIKNDRGTVLHGAASSRWYREHVDAGVQEGGCAGKNRARHDRSAIIDDLHGDLDDLSRESAHLDALLEDAGEGGFCFAPAGAAGEAATGSFVCCGAGRCCVFFEFVCAQTPVHLDLDTSTLCEFESWLLFGQGAVHAREGSTASGLDTEDNAKTKSRRGEALLNTKYKPSGNLLKAIKTDKVTRPEAVKLLWQYIKDKKLKSSEVGSLIQLDDVLKALAKGKISNEKEIKHTDVMKLLKSELTKI
ncbi:Hypothetical Protein FCC1311_031962 [Hondaea fermentalgiana]|uniref:DM2 domain-containing protein n=1 Tax=Hondaea fermentalgiana TaxID=2315210 RepID=A0A2R5GEB7_9STRA|nr:Hypothetical Protein FCC1311_031962 [Hondaea fermentalgiana]|eukprot:GBG26973.1 Hypothetical Protein FCC1311_031962 [Hondaea fermentalgiana]